MKKHNAFESFKTSRWYYTVVTIDCNKASIMIKPQAAISLLIEIVWAGSVRKKRHRLHTSLHPKPHLLQSCRERHSINMFLNSIKSRPMYKQSYSHVLQVFNKSACKLNSNTFSFFWCALLSKTPWELLFCMCTKCFGPKRKGLHGRKCPKPQKAWATCGWPTKQWGWVGKMEENNAMGWNPNCSQ